MYWLYACWNPHHKHTLHCCTLSSPTLKSVCFYYGPLLSFRDLYSIVARDRGEKKRKKKKKHAWDDFDLLVPPRRNQTNFSNSQIFWKFFGLSSKEGLGGRGGAGRERKGKLLERNQSIYCIIYTSSIRFLVSIRHRCIYTDLSLIPKKIILSKHNSSSGRATKEALKSVYDTYKLPHPRQCVVSPVVPTEFCLVLHSSSTTKRASSLVDSTKKKKPLGSSTT